MRYKIDLSPRLNLSSPPASGANFSSTPASGTAAPTPFIAWQPNTWPAPPKTADDDFIMLLKRIFEESMLIEIQNVIEDAKRGPEGLQHRGHVVAIALMSALDAVARFGYDHSGGAHMKTFVATYFCKPYQPLADYVYVDYRCSLLHEWNLFRGTIYPDDKPLAINGCSVSFGLLSFFDALKEAVGNFLEAVAADKNLQDHALERYRYLKQTAKP